MDLTHCWLPRQEIHQENKGDHIGVTEEAAAGGRRSLKLKDAPGLQFSYNPHLVLRPRYTSGVATVSIDFRLDPGAQFYVEWRDTASDYRTGPSVSFGGDGTMQIRNGPCTNGVAAGPWMRLELRAGLGAQATGTCEVRLRRPGDTEALVWRDAPCQAGWTDFASLVIAMTSDADTALYLDNLTVTCE